jgi:hypothetical protein
MQPKTIKSKNNGCGTAPDNLVYALTSQKMAPRLPKIHTFAIEPAKENGFIFMGKNICF